MSDRETPEEIAARLRHCMCDDGHRPETGHSRRCMLELQKIASALRKEREVVDQLLYEQRELARERAREAEERAEKAEAEVSRMKLRAMVAEAEVERLRDMASRILKTGGERADDE